MDWFSLSETNYTELNESGWEGLSDGTPSSVTGPVYWKTINNFDFGLLSENQWESQQEVLHTDPPYVASGYVTGVCAHEVVIISN